MRTTEVSEILATIAGEMDKLKKWGYHFAFAATNHTFTDFESRLSLPDEGAAHVTLDLVREVLLNSPQGEEYAVAETPKIEKKVDTDADEAHVIHILLGDIMKWHNRNHVTSKMVWLRDTSK